ncbi:MAG: CHAT domain-containing protein [Psychrosphaera sp.]|nr:CHAT domain-containing protein [Psychrosphaera sp.]
MIQSHPVSYATNAPSWFGARSVDTNNNDFTAKVMSDQCLGHFAAAPLFDEEAKLVAQTLNCETFVTGDGTGNALAFDSPPAIFHAACHGCFDPELPLMSGIWVSNNGQPNLVTLEHFIKEKVATRLLFLSGCDTGRQGAVDAEETLGLARAIQMQHTPTARLSLWPVCANDPVIPELVNKFYQGWVNQGLGKAKALQQAMLSCCSDNPYFWACYVVYGDGGV